MGYTRKIITVSFHVTEVHIVYPRFWPNKMKSQILFFTILSVVTVYGQDSKFYCGRNVPKALDLLCPNGPVLMKRDRPYPFNHFGYSYDDEIAYDLPWIARYKAKSMERGKRQGVATECCDKPCAISELLSYCPNWRNWGTMARQRWWTILRLFYKQITINLNK